MRAHERYRSQVQRAAVVVQGEPNTVTTAKLAWDMARERGDSTITAVAWEHVKRLPSWVNIALQDQLHAHRRDTPNSHYVIVWFGTDAEIESVAEDGDPLDEAEDRES